MNLSNFFKLNKKESKPSVEEREYTILNKEALAEEKKVAVVVPVYNAEEYVRKTVDSVILQNIGFQHISLILVDDCSTDDSRNILTEYAELYENITVVFLKDNTGTPLIRETWGLSWQMQSTLHFWMRMIGLRRTELKSYSTCLKEIR